MYRLQGRACGREPEGQRGGDPGQHRQQPDHRRRHHEGEAGGPREQSGRLARAVDGGGALAAVPVVGPFLAQLGPSLAAGIKKIVGKVGGFFKRLFGGGDEAKAAAVAKALEIAQAATAAAIEAARAASQAVAQAVADAAVAAAEGTLAVATKMADAILAGITDAANAALADITELANAALAAATTAANAALQTVQDAATAMEGTLQGAIGAHDRAKDAGVQAYNEVSWRLRLRRARVKWRPQRQALRRRSAP